ncbi:hypothetical protein T190_30080 [Sinorhizobium meliloti CCBAU 01290]|nr:hypothetical protein T190_30080 [Sinorhizobium meliloti CCBAU 01290]
MLVRLTQIDYEREMAFVASIAKPANWLEFPGCTRTQITRLPNTAC